MKYGGKRTRNRRLELSNMQDCIFCKIVKSEIPSHKIYEDEDVLAFLDINPINPGHTLVIPKAHHENILDTPPDILCKLITTTQTVAPAVIAAVGTDGFHLDINNGATAGQVVFHAHFHIMPRFAGDGYELWKGRQASQAELAEVAEKVRSNL